MLRKKIDTVVAVEMKPGKIFVNVKQSFSWEEKILLFSMSVTFKFGIKDDTEVLLMRKFRDSVIIECDCLIHICL